MQSNTVSISNKIQGFATDNISDSKWQKMAIAACAGMADPTKEIAELRQALSGRTVSCERCNDSATLRDQLHRICQEGFGNQDTIGGEAADDYVLRRLTAMREAIREAHNAIKASPYPDQQALAKLQPFLK